MLDRLRRSHAPMEKRILLAHALRASFRTGVRRSLLSEMPRVLAVWVRCTMRYARSQAVQTQPFEALAAV